MATWAFACTASLVPGVRGDMVYRVRLAKLEEIMFVSHLGTMRAFERAVRRAGLPVAYSSGYHPHPKISFATALGVGMTSEAEYVDIELTDALGSRAVLTALTRALPPGLRILAAATVRVDSRTGLASGIRWASYTVPLGAGSAAATAVAIERFMAMNALEVVLEGKAGAKTVDIRPLVRCAALARAAAGAGDEGGADSFEFTIACGGRAHLRPGDFIAAIQRITGECTGTEGAPVHRTGLFFEFGNELVEPLAHECTDLVRS